jgi:nucleotide-binding universal stress UspA family protein
MGSPIRRVLVPIDLSADAGRAIDPALRIAQRAEAPLVLFSWVFDEGIRSEAAEAERYLLDVAGKLPGLVQVDVAMTRDRSPAPSINAAAARIDATVCMASHGRRGVGRAVLGSVAEETLRLLRRPSLLVGPQVTGEPIGGSPSIVACVDGTPLSETVLPVACDWARQLRRPLQVVNVLEPATGYGPPDEGPVEHGYLAGLVAGLECGEAADYEVLHGHPAQAITSFAGNRAELVAVASHGRSGIARSVLGSVAMDVVHRARRPVLVVPAPAKD